MLIIGVSSTLNSYHITIPRVEQKNFNKNVTPFINLYVWTGISALILIKLKYLSKINVEKEMRIVISKLEPRFENIMKHKLI